MNNNINCVCGEIPTWFLFSLLLWTVSWASYSSVLLLQNMPGINVWHWVAIFHEVLHVPAFKLLNARCSGFVLFCCCFDARGKDINGVRGFVCKFLVSRKRAVCSLAWSGISGFVSASAPLGLAPLKAYISEAAV